MTGAPDPTHEAMARRRRDGFVAACTCGWFGHDVRDRREATRAALEHEMRAAQRRERLLRIALEQGEVSPEAVETAAPQAPSLEEMPLDIPEFDRDGRFERPRR